MNWFLHQVPVFEKIDSVFWILSILWVINILFDTRYEIKQGVLEGYHRAIFFSAILVIGGFILFVVAWDFAKNYPPFKLIDVIYWLIALLAATFCIPSTLNEDKKAKRIIDSAKKILEAVLISLSLILVMLSAWFLLWLSIKFFWDIWLLSIVFALIIILMKKWLRKIR